MSSPAAPAAPAAPDLRPATRPPLRVLVCDDNAISQKVAARLLQQLGCQTDVAASGREALARLDAQPYDLIFMDVMMPEMDGLQATREIRLRQKDVARHPNYASPIAIVAMTAGAMSDDRERCSDAGMDDYLAKPVRLEGVRSMIERWGAPPAAEVTASAPAPPVAPGAGDNAAIATTPPVDLARLRELTDDTPAGVAELVDLYLEQTTTQMGQLAEAIRTGQADSVRRVAHSSAGSSATCGVTELVPLLRQLEHLGREQNLAGAESLLDAAEREFARVRSFLTPYTGSANQQASGN